jgi:hypothetical protein
MLRKRTLHISAFAPALVLAACTYDYDRFDPSAGGAEGGAADDVAVAESSGGDASAPQKDGGVDARPIDGGGPDAPSDESGGPRDGGNDSSGMTYTIGGTLQGMKNGRSVTLQDNGADDLVVPMNGPFVFSQALLSGAAYAVTVSAQPPAQTCSVMAGSGVVASANVTSVVVTCQ